MLDNQHVNIVRIWGGGVIEDDYFSMIPEKPKTIEAAMLEKTSSGAVKLTVGIHGDEEGKQVIVLK